MSNARLLRIRSTGSAIRFITFVESHGAFACLVGMRPASCPLQDPISGLEHRSDTMKRGSAWRCFCGVTVTWILVACSSGDSGKSGQSEPMQCDSLTYCGEGRTCAYLKNSDSSVSRCVPVECAALDECCLGLPPAEAEGCRDLAASLVASDCASELESRRAAGYCVTDPTTTRMCNLNDRGCDSFLVGRGNTTASCCTGAICFTGKSITDGTDGTCVSCLPEGTACDRTLYEDRCCPGTYCEVYGSTCVALQPEGGSCSSSLDCASLWHDCLNGVCGPRSGSGGGSGGSGSGGSTGTTCDPSSCNGLDCAGGFCCSSFCEGGSCKTVCN